MRETTLLKRMMTVALAAVLVVIAVALAGAFIVVTKQVERAFDAQLQREAALILAGVTRGHDGTLTFERAPEDGDFNRILSGWYWQVTQAGEVIARSRSLVAERLAEASGSEAMDAQGPRKVALRLATARGSSAGGFIVTVAGPREVIGDQIRAEFVFLAAGMIAVAVALAGALAWAIQRSLLPLQILAHETERLSAGEAQYINRGPYRDINRMVDTVNALVDETRRLVAANRDSAGKLAHGLKTPLARIAARAGNRGQRPDAPVLEAVEDMRRLIDHNLARLRAASPAMGTNSPVLLAPVLRDLALALGHHHRDRHVAIDIDVPEDAAIHTEKEDLEEILGNTLDNAYRFASARICVSATVEDSVVGVVIDDDGPGFRDERCENDASIRNLEPSPTPGSSTSGLGLTIARELAMRHGGQLELSRSDCGGARVSIRFPRRASRQYELASSARSRIAS